jgi:hypothetical protein
MAVKKASKAPKEDAGIQDLFMKRFKQSLPPGMGMAEEIADILEVSIDSAYRRIRGETELTIGEIFRITGKYAISMDEVFGNRGDTVIFAYTKLTDSEINFESYLRRLHDHLAGLRKFTNRKIYYVAEEIPMFYSFFSQKLTEFKLFFWQRSVLNIARYQQTKFKWGLIPQNLVDLAHDSYKEYLTIPSTEVWTDETVLTGLKQVSFYYDSGILSKEHAIELLQEYRKMIEMVKANAESGRKNISDKDETFVLYTSEVVLGTNCIYVIMGDTKYSYISFNSINSLTTNNPEFCEETDHWVRNLERKSTLISGVAEKQRYQFFSRMFRIIDDCNLKITNS